VARCSAKAGQVFFAGNGSPRHRSISVARFMGGRCQWQFSRRRPRWLAKAGQSSHYVGRWRTRQGAADIDSSRLERLAARSEGLTIA